jgi:hypothetical protein
VKWLVNEVNLGHQASTNPSQASTDLGVNTLGEFEWGEPLTTLIEVEEDRALVGQGQLNLLVGRHGVRAPLDPGQVGDVFLLAGIILNDDSVGVEFFDDHIYRSLFSW